MVRSLHALMTNRIVHRYWVTLLGIVSFLFLLPSLSEADVSRENLIIGKLNSPVEIIYDNYGIPHIRAANLHDLYFAQGYVQARDRLWQMDIARRAATGRLAEIFGEGHLEKDFSIYITQIPQVSELIWESSDAEMKEMFNAFADGVNTYIKSLQNLPEEYVETGAQPESWHPVDSIAIGRAMSWHLSSDLGLEVKLTLSKVMETIGRDAFLDIVPYNGADPITIVRRKSAKNSDADRFGYNPSLGITGGIFSPDFHYAESFFGSNNWVISGEKSDSGFPILSNDPHLGLDNPPIWYEAHLSAPGINVVGSTFSGVPGVIIGHNEHTAWGVTTVGYDVTDIYVEKLDPQKPDTHYLHRGESLPFKEEKVKLRFKTKDGIKTQERVILHSVHGPIVHESSPKFVLSYRWTGHIPSYEVRCFYEINRARNPEDFKKALNYFEVGAQNFVYADDDGNIFYRAAGKVPIRKGTPFLPLDGSSGEYEWTGYIPYDELPSALNPTEGFIATANNRPIDDDYPYYIGVYFDKGYRARRITDRLEAKKKISFSEMQAIQADVYSLPGERLLPLLFSAEKRFPGMLSERAREAIKILRNWDFQTTTDSVASSIFHKWLRFVIINTFSDEGGDGVIGYLSSSEVIFPLLLREKPLPVNWYDDRSTPDVEETKDMILLRSLNDAVMELVRQYGDDMNKWRWGELHQLTLGHELGGHFNLGPYEVDGAVDTVDNTGFGLTGLDFNFGHGPSMRMTVELKPGAVRGENVIPGGQSGDRNSPHYADQMPLWLRNEAHPMLFREDEINASAEKILVLN
ncbi:MAG: penicillin acylase family protein [bacterium]